MVLAPLSAVLSSLLLQVKNRWNSTLSKQEHRISVCASQTQMHPAPDPDPDTGTDRHTDTDTGRQTDTDRRTLTSLAMHTTPTATARSTHRWVASRCQAPAQQRWRARQRRVERICSINSSGGHECRWFEVRDGGFRDWNQCRRGWGSAA